MFIQGSNIYINLNTMGVHNLYQLLEKTRKYIIDNGRRMSRQWLLSPWLFSLDTKHSIILTLYLFA